MNTPEDLLKPDVETAPSSNLIIKHEEEQFSIDKKKVCCVVLNDGVTYFNLFTYYLVQFSYVCAFTFIDACQDHLLEDKDFYAIDPKETGTINGDILLYDTLFLVNHF